jgi:hypothetical protein
MVNAMAPEDREKSFERALANKLRVSAVRDTSPSLSSPAGCPDVETLAAFHDCLLDAQQAILCKEHVAACPHCGEIVSSLETTEEIPLSGELPENLHDSVLLPQSFAASLPVATQAREMVAAESSERSTKRGRGTRGILSRWLVPIGAVAAASLISVGVVYLRRQKSAVSEIASNKTAAQNQLPRSLTSEAATAKSSVTNSGAEEARKKEAGQARDQLTTSPAPTPAMAREADARKDSAAQSASSEKTSSGAKTTDAQKQTVEAANAPVVVAAPPPPPPKSQSAASSGDVINSALQEQKEARSGVSIQAPGLKSKQSAGLIGGARAANAFGPGLAKFREVTITSLDGNSLWRLRRGGVIEHTVDGGSTWLPQVSGISTDLLAGSSPSETVCWVVGRAGMILLTTDGGGHWSKIESPTPDDLGYVTATDDQRVRIADVTNQHRFSTSDGGQNWVQSRSQ